MIDWIPRKTLTTGFIFKEKKDKNEKKDMKIKKQNNVDI